MKIFMLLLVFVSCKETEYAKEPKHMTVCYRQGVKCEKFNIWYNSATCHIGGTMYINGELACKLEKE